jgi:murein DD-endopeptidase MepM/ murein hydrolase activator NlpD
MKFNRNSLPQLPNETIECYAARASGEAQPDPESEKPKDKIETNNIAANCKMEVNTTFKMTPESTLPVSWELELKDGTVVITPSDLGLSFNNTTGELSGTVASSFEKKTITASLKAKKADNSIVDEKAFTFVAKKCDPNDLKFIHPDPGSRTGDLFGNRFHPIYKRWKMHKGQDFCSHGQNDIVAAADGIIKFAGVQNGYGNCIEIEHNDANGKLLATTFYAHLSIIHVHSGQVAAGQVIGHEGSTGNVTGPHLHFEIRLNGTTPVDPLLYINGSLTQ